jgi:hypothetical protein
MLIAISIIGQINSFVTNLFAISSSSLRRSLVCRRQPNGVAAPTCESFKLTMLYPCRQESGATTPPLRLSAPLSPQTNSRKSCSCFQNSLCISELMTLEISQVLEVIVIRNSNWNSNWNSNLE